MRNENREFYFKKAEEIAHTLKEIARAKMSATDLKFWEYQKMINKKKEMVLQKLDRRNDL